MKVNLGCGTDIRPGWINVDIGNNISHHQDYMSWDLRNGFPDSDRVRECEIIFISHVNEHLSPEANIKLLRGCKQALSSSGKLYVELPDFVSVIKAYLAGDWAYFNDPSILAFAPNRLIGQCLDYALHQRNVTGSPEHITFIDEEIFQNWLKQAGFTTSYRSSFIKGISNPNPLRQKYSLYFEAY